MIPLVFSLNSAFGLRAISMFICLNHLVYKIIYISISTQNKIKVLKYIYFYISSFLSIQNLTVYIKCMLAVYTYKNCITMYAFIWISLKKKGTNIQCIFQMLRLFLFVSSCILPSGRYDTISSSEKTSEKWQIADLNWDQYIKLQELMK